MNATGGKLLKVITSLQMTDCDGYIEKKNGGRYGGEIVIEGINLSPIDAIYFKEDGDTYLWLKRKPCLVYDYETQSYNTRELEPRWECYLKKEIDGDAVAYKGEFIFMRFRFSIKGVWDTVFGMDSRHRLNLFVERLPMNKQTIINGINEKNRENAKRSK